MPRGAGAGRPRKDGPTRHRNPSQRDSIVVAADARAQVVPEPVYPLTTASGRELWEFLWGLPIASLWDPADAPAITRMVQLQSKRSGTLDPRTLAEIRQLEDRFLLNPYARAQQRVVIEHTAGAGSDAQGAAGVTELDQFRSRLQKGGKRKK